MARAPSAEPASLDWRAHVAEATIGLDAEGRIRSFAAGRQDVLAPLGDDDGLYLVDRSRASDRVVVLHALARLAAGEPSVECDVSLRIDEAGRDWVDVALVLVPMGEGSLAFASVRSPSSEAAEPEPQPRDDETTAELAHELRTPLNAIIGYGQALEAGLFGTLGARQRDAVVNMVEAGEHLVEIANTVLDAARLGAEDVSMAWHVAPIAQTVARSCSMVASLADRSGVTLANRVTERCGASRHDAAALRQIVVNLLSNAVKASERGAVVGIEARRTVEGGVAGMEIAVHDEGHGMSEAEMQALGRRFGRGRSCEGETTGGLGVPLVQRLVDRHGGTLRFSSEQGRGTTAAVFLPDTVTEEARAPAAVEKVVGLDAARASLDQETAPPVRIAVARRAGAR